ncbi:MAG TPA: hypothetical protein VNP89_08105 [Gaiellaceae bacterium]|nr:hypothetical protein [Gaiellaceae bacterium]
MRRTFLWINFVLASIIVLGVFAQAYLIASYAMGAGEDALDAHGVVGGLVIHLSELLVFLTAFGAWPRAWRWIAFCFSLFFVGTVQIFLLPPDDDPVSKGEAYVHGLHGLFAIVVLVMAAVIAHRGMRDLGLRRSGRGDDAGTAPPQPIP